MALDWFTHEAPEAIKVAALCAIPTIGFWATTGPFLQRYYKWYMRKRRDGREDGDLEESMRLVNVTTRNVSVGFASYVVWKECDFSFEEAATPLASYVSLLAFYWTYHPVVLGLGWTRWGVWHSTVVAIAAATTLGLFWKVSQPAGVAIMPFFFYVTTVAVHNWKEVHVRTKRE